MVILATGPCDRVDRARGDKPCKLNEVVAPRPRRDVRAGPCLDCPSGHGPVTHRLISRMDLPTSGATATLTGIQKLTASRIKVVMAGRPYDLTGKLRE